MQTSAYIIYKPHSITKRSKYLIKHVSVLKSNNTESSLSLVKKNLYSAAANIGTTEINVLPLKPFLNFTEPSLTAKIV